MKRIVSKIMLAALVATIVAPAQAEFSLKAGINAKSTKVASLILAGTTLCTAAAFYLNKKMYSYIKLLNVENDFEEIKEKVLVRKKPITNKDIQVLNKQILAASLLELEKGVLNHSINQFKEDSTELNAQAFLVFLKNIRKRYTPWYAPVALQTLGALSIGALGTFMYNCFSK